jgi:hypothetical protein
MDTLRRFLTDREDNRELFKGLAVESSDVWGKANSAPVFYFDFKNMAVEDYRDSIFGMIRRYLRQYYSLISNSPVREMVDEYLDMRVRERDGLRLLTEVAYEATGKRAYVFIDEYDKLLLDIAGTEYYREIRNFLTYLFSAAFKTNEYLERGLLAGVMRISYEGLFSGLNNVVVFDVFGDSRYSCDFGITEDEMAELSRRHQMDIDAVRDWYNGFSVGGTKLCNIFSVSSYLSEGRLDTFWGKSGTMDLVAGAMNAERLDVLTRIVSGEQMDVPLARLSSLGQLNDDAVFYSLLVQAGYVSIVDGAPGSVAVCVPNREMAQIWREFIFSAVMPENKTAVGKLFAERGADRFATSMERIMTDALSYWDLSGDIEQVYHVFLLGGLVFSDPLFDKAKAKSNREAGDGRYDIWMERNGRNYIFELKMCDSEKELGDRAELALRQIDEKRYGAELDRGKPLWKVGVSCFGKRCNVKCEVDGGLGEYITDCI